MLCQTLAARSITFSIALASGFGFLVTYPVGVGFDNAQPAYAQSPGLAGEIIYIARSNSPTCLPPAGLDKQIWELDSTSGSKRQLTCEAGDPSHPSTSPDGTQIAYSLYSEPWHSAIYTIQASIPTGSFAVPTQVTSGSTDRDTEPAWDPDGSGQIVFTRSVAGAPSQLWLVPTSLPGPPSPLFKRVSPLVSDSQAVFSPTNPAQVYFVRSAFGHSHIYRADTRTLSFFDLSAAAGNEGTFDAQPNVSLVQGHEEVVFESNRECGDRQLYSMSSSGSDLSPIYVNATTGRQICIPMCPGETFDLSPSLSADGNELAYVDEVDEKLGIFTTFLSFDGARLVGSGFPPRYFKQAITGGFDPDWLQSPQAGPPPNAPESPVAVLLPIAGIAVVAAFLRRARKLDLRYNLGNEERQT